MTNIEWDKSTEGNEPLSELRPKSIRAQSVAILKEWFGLLPSPIRDGVFPSSEIAGYYDVKTRAEDPLTANRLDEQTWRELGLDGIRNLIGAKTSLFGQQILHHDLRSGAWLQCGGVQAGKDGAKYDRRTVAKLLNDAALRKNLQAKFDPLRRADTDISELLFVSEAEAATNWRKWLLILPSAFLTAAISVYFSLYAVIALLLVLAAILWTQNNLFLQLQQWKQHEASLGLLLTVCTTLGKHFHKDQSEIGSALRTPFVDIHKQVKSIHRAITRLPLFDIIPGLSDYADWFFLGNVRHYFHCKAVLKRHETLLQHVYEITSRLEAALALARHLANRGGDAPICWSTLADSAGRTVALTDFVHPQLAGAKALSLTLDRQGALITGQNGIGKSTLLKSIGVNIVVGQAFGFCYAHEAVISTAPVYTSLSNEDSLSTAESLYMAELRRAKELLMASKLAPGCVCLIDEIFRGTNHLEAVSAASAVLKSLSKSAIVVVSSHHVVLAPLLATTLRPIYLDISGESRVTLRIVEGVLGKPNGLALLASYDFGDEIVAHADRVAAWLTRYLSEPVIAPHDLLR